MKTVIKLTFATTIFAFIFSCSTPELESTGVEADNLTTTLTKKTSNDLADKTITYFNTIEKNVKSEDDLEYAESLSEALVTEWEKVLGEKGGLKEAQNALKILEESNKMAFQATCAQQLRGCVRYHLVKLVLHYAEHGSDGIGEAVDAALNGIIGCVSNFLGCID